MSTTKIDPWVRLAHNALGLLRSLTADPQLGHDAANQAKLGEQLRARAEQIAREAIGCEQRPGCRCAIHREQEGKR